jgi:very-short-patch-repair endonuclease
VYATVDACPAVVEAAEHGGTVACVTAARHLGLWVLGEHGLHVWLNDGGHRRAAAADEPSVLHWDSGPTSGFAPPSVPRILRQMLACCGIEAFFVALESARRQELIDRDGLRWLCAATNLLAREAVQLSRDDADSGLESLLRWRLRAYDLPVRTQVRIAGVGIVDILIGDRLIVEADGRDNHDGDGLRHKDLVRDATAAVWGYETLRFDYALIVHDWPLVEAAILAAVAEGRHVSSA